MGLYTEEQQQEFLLAMRHTARQTLEKLQRVTKLASFGANPESLRALDQFADEVRTKGTVTADSTRFFIVGLGTLLGDLLLKKYGGKWVIDKDYSIETLSRAGATVHLLPYAPVAARLKGNTAASCHRYYFVEAPTALGFAVPAPDPKDAMLERIKNNAAAVVKMFSSPGQPALGLTANSVAALDDYLGRTLNPSTTDATKEKLMNLIGSFLGECIVAKYGAQWVITDDGKVHMQLSSGKTLHFLDPFGKVVKRIQNGPEDNLTAYFAQLIPHVIKASG